MSSSPARGSGPPVLLLTGESPIPAVTGARLRTLHLARQLGMEMALEVAAVGAVPAQETEPFELVGVGRPRSRWRSAAVSLRRPYMAARMSTPALARHAGRGGWATVQAEFPFLVPAALRAGAPVVLDAHNVETDVVAGFASGAPALSRPRWLWEQAKTERFEISAVSSAAAVCATSDADAERLVELGARRVLTVPNGIDAAGLPFRAPPSNHAIIFVGYMGYRPNSAAAIELTEDIWPRVRREVPDAELTVVGREPPERLSKREADGLKVTGEVADVVPYLRSARVTVVPLRAGSGTRFKILEAMALGVPVVTTAIGMAGIAARAGRHLLVGTTPRELAELTVRVLTNDALAAALSQSARELVEARYDWSVVAGPLVELHLQLSRARVP